MLERLREIVEAGQRQGTMRPDIDPEVVAWKILGVARAEDFAALQGLDEYWSKGTAGKMRDSFIAEIAAQPYSAETAIDTKHA
jgi:hypothetical protein